MKEPRHDDERLAALLAGRLEGPERDELLAYLSTADEDYEVFADTAAILREMEEEDAQAAEAGVQVADPPPRPEVLPPSMTKRAQGWRRSPRWAIPLALVGLVVLAMFALRGPSAPAGPLQVAANLERAGQGPAPAEWDEPDWPGTVRGAGAEASDPATAAQAGASLMRLVVAVQAGDSAATVLWARRTAQFDPQGASALEQIEARAGAPAPELDPLLEQATERLEGRMGEMGRDDLRLGAWTEAARLAALTADAAFFRSDDSRAMLRRAEELTEDNAEARVALQDVRASLDADGAPDWDALEARLRMLLEALGTERR